MALLKCVFLSVVSAVLLAATAAPTLGADLQWTSAGSLPQGVSAFSVAQDPATPGSLWAATNGQGLQHTEDGKTWRQVAAGVVPARLWQIEIDPSKGPGGFAPMYVGSSGQGFFKSLDAGKTWQGSVQGLGSPASRNVRAIAMGVNLLVIGTSDGAYKSVDGGRTWQAAGLSGYDLSAMAFARYANPVVLVAAIDGISNPGSRVVMSKDLGVTWTPIKQGLPADLVVSSLASGVLPAGAPQRPLFLVGSAGVFKSDDGGQGWGQVTGLPPQGYGALAVSPADANILYVGSDGGGGTGGGGVWRSADRGGTWTALPGGLTDKGITALSVGRDNPATVVAAAWSPDKGTAPLFTLSDTQAPPQGQPEGGVCPEPACQGGTQPVASPTVPPVATASPSPSPTPTPRPSPTAARSASPVTGAGTTAPTPGTAAGSTVLPEPCIARSPAVPVPPHRSDLPLPLVIGVALVLAGLLLGSLVVTRLRG
ncbi:MAG: hypothetical protein NVSMB17_07750 [Candidatus Dormibacteria bacterium]